MRRADGPDWLDWLEVPVIPGVVVGLVVVLGLVIFGID